MYLQLSLAGLHFSGAEDDCIAAGDKQSMAASESTRKLS